MHTITLLYIIFSYNMYTTLIPCLLTILVYLYHQVLFEPDWNPSTDQQAMGRVYREGQLKPVWIYRLAGYDSIDSGILARQGKKDELRMLVETSAAIVGNEPTATDDSKVTETQAKKRKRSMANDKHTDGELSVDDETVASHKAVDCSKILELVGDPSSSLGFDADTLSNSLLPIKPFSSTAHLASDTHCTRKDVGSNTDSGKSSRDNTDPVLYDVINGYLKNNIVIERK